jgi:hypothetical protein
MDDIESMSAWERLFGEPFEATLVFLHWLDGPAPIIREPGAFRFEGRSYAPRAVRVAEYTRRMCVRSPRWGTVHLPEEVYERIWADLPDLLSAASRNGR